MQTHSPGVGLLKLLVLPGGSGGGGDGLLLPALCRGEQGGALRRGVLPHSQDPASIEEDTIQYSTVQYAFFGSRRQRTILIYEKPLFIVSKD